MVTKLTYELGTGSLWFVTSFEGEFVPVPLAHVVGAVLGLAHAALRMELHTSNLDLIDPGLPEVRAFLDFSETFGTPNVLIVVLEGPDTASVRQAVDLVAPGLRAAEGVLSLVDRLPVDEDTLAFLDIEPYLLSDDGLMAFVMALGCKFLGRLS